MQRSSYLQRCGGRCSRPVNQPRRRCIIVTRDYTEDGARPSNFVIAAACGHQRPAPARAPCVVRACVWSTVRRCSSAPDANCRRSSRAKTYTRGLGGGGGGEIADVICGCSEMRRQRGQRGRHLLGGLGSLQADRSRCSLSVALSSTHCHHACRHGPGARFTIYLTIIIRLS